MTSQLSPADFNATGGQPQLAGAAYPTAFSSNLVGGHRRTFKRFMRGKKSYKKGVRKHISSSGLFSRMMRKMKGSRRK
jgi:hypothetical protein